MEFVLFERAIDVFKQVLCESMYVVTSFLKGGGMVTNPDST